MKCLPGLLLSALLLVGCGEEDDPTRNNDFVPLTAITIKSQYPVIADGTSNQFTAEGDFSGEFKRDITDEVTWSTNSPEVLTISPSGLGKAGNSGTLTVTATRGEIRQDLIVNVVDATLQNIVVSPASSNVPKGLTRQFTATGTFTHSTDQQIQQDITRDVTWASAPEDIATIHPSSGLATAMDTGSATITATFAEDTGNVSGTATLNVTAAMLQSIAITPATPTMVEGEELGFKATGSYSDDSKQDVTAQASWSSTDETVATISNPGGAAKAVATGTTTIRADFEGRSTTTVLTVASVTAIQITPANPTVGVSEQVELTATATLAGGGTRDISEQALWSIIAISGSDAATGSSVTRGMVTAGSNTGTMTVRATLDGINGSTTVTITQ